jgi:hypothetical protein
VQSRASALESATSSGWEKLGDQDLIPCFASPRCVLPINMTDQKSGERVVSILVHGFPV